MKKRKILSLLVICSMVFTLIPPIQASATPNLTDIAGHWAEADIRRAVEHGFVQGFPDGTFRPDDPVTRAQFTTMVNRALGNTGTAALTFTDVPHYEWFHADVARAFAAAYVGGFEDNTFRPNNPITRQEAAVMLSRIIPTHGASGNLNVFGDRGDIADWAFSAMQKINGRGYMGGFDDGRLHPLANLTRAQTARIIGQILENENIVRTDPIARSGQTFSNTIFPNGLTIHADVGSGTVNIENSVILGTLRVQGGGTGNNGVIFNNSRAAQVVVERTADPVRFLVRGESVVVALTAARSATIQTQNLTGGLHGSGIGNLTTLAGSNIRLEGSFPTVTVNGSSASLTLGSGTITNLTVSSNATNAEVTVESGATVSVANVNARSEFKGQGTITTMNANANNITYERRPSNVNTASGITPPTLSTPAPRITFNPANGATNVPRGSNITITFDSAMTLQNGNAITNANIENFVNLRRGSATGAHVPFTASINSARTVITIFPDEQFHNNTTYHLNIPANRLRDANGEYNTVQNISFSTGTASAFVTFTPSQGQLIAPTARDLTIVFSEAVQTNTGATVTLDWLRNNSVFVLRTGTTATGGSAVAFTVQSWNANTRTAVIRANNNFSHGDFYLGVAADRLRTTANQTPIPATGITFTVGDGHTISFNNNGGSGTMSTVTVNRNSNFTVPANTFTAPSGRVFHNWNTQPGGGGSTFIPGSVMHNVTQNWTLYAQWGHSVTFNANIPAGQAGASGMPANTTVARNASYNAPNVTPTRAGFTFRGWHTAATLPAGTAAIQPNGLVSNQVQANINLFAIWDVAATVAPTITTHPTNQPVFAGSNATFGPVAATGTPTPTFQWQVSTDNGATWSNVSGATGATFTLTNVAIAQNGNQYRVVATNSAGSVNSNPATLTVSPAPVTITGVTISPAGTINIAQGGTQPFTATVAGTGAFDNTVSWELVGTPASGTSLSNVGVLTVASDETSVLVVRARSTQDPAHYAEATVIVSVSPGGSGD